MIRQIVLYLVFVSFSVISSGCSKNANESPTTTTTTGKTDDPKKDQGSKKPEFSLTAVDFVNEFQANPYKARHKYESKVVEIAGEVFKVGRQDISLSNRDSKKGEGGDVLIACVLMVDQYVRGHHLSHGQRIKVLGELEGSTKTDARSIILRNCSITEVTKSELVEISAETLAKEFAQDLKGATAKYKRKGVIVLGQVEDLKENIGPTRWDHGSAKLKGDSKLVVSVLLSHEAYSSLQKGQTVRLRAMFGEAPVQNNEIFIIDGFVAAVK